MPYVQINWVTGRSPEQKCKFGERTTAALVEDGRAKRENVHASFVDVPPTDYDSMHGLYAAALSGISDLVAIARLQP